VTRHIENPLEITTKNSEGGKAYSPPKERHNMAFKIGDTVKLKSGGPVMSITSNDGGGRWWCDWFSKDGKVDSKAFPEAALVAAEPAEETSF
jgi:uncharacterized protein YodC (DUF2158 family)